MRAVGVLAHDRRTRLQVSMKVDNQLALILSKLNEQLKGIAESNQRLHDVHDSVAELIAVKVDFDRWRPKVDGQVADLWDCIDSLRQQVDELKSTLAIPLCAGDGPAQFEMPGSAYLDPSSKQAASGPSCHGGAPQPQSDGSGIVYTILKPPPVNGTNHESHPHHSGFSFSHHNACAPCSHLNSAMPQVDFPKFRSTSPKFWIKQCDTYFDLYDVPP